MKRRTPKPPDVPPVRARERAALPAAVLIALAAVAVYAGALDAPFVLDDHTSIRTNASIRGLWPLTDVLTPPRDTPVAGRPLVNLSLALNYAAGGLDPRGYRAVNLALHVVAAWLLFGIVRRTVAGSRVPDVLRPRAYGVALASALLWTVHPLQTEVITYVTQRTTGLKALLYLATLYCAIRALGRASGRWQAAAVAACAAGMLCKESMVTAPVMVALYDRVFAFDSWREAMRARRGLYLGLASSWFVLAGVMASGPRSTVGFDGGIGAWTYLLNQATILIDYLWLAVLPRALVADYGVPLPLTAADVVLPALAVLALAGVTLVALVRMPPAGYLGAWWFITIAPTSSFVPIVSEVGAERRMYLPLAALVVLAVCAAARALAARPVPAGVPAAATLVVCVALAGGAILRNAEYGSGLRLAQTIAERRPHGRAYLRVGALLLDAGRRDEAMTYFRMAEKTEAMGASFALGTELIIDGDYDAGIRELHEFIARYPRHVNVPAAREGLAAAYLALQQPDEAAAQLEALLVLDPEHVSTRRALGDVRLRQNRLEEALPHLEFVAARQPDADALTALGTALALLNRHDEALAALTRAVHAHPGHAPAHYLLGRVLASQGQLAEALRHFERAAAMAPGNETFRRDLARARAEAASPTTGPR